jgi:glutathione S-transferase
MITLYQFAFSHYCEKARWALDHKGIAYNPINLLPGLHLNAARKLAGTGSLPILVDDSTVVQDSTAIITYLDQRFPDHPLTPEEPAAAREAMAWEEYFDEEIGAPMRLWFYHHALPDRRCALRFLLEGRRGNRARFTRRSIRGSAPRCARR